MHRCDVMWKKKSRTYFNNESQTFGVTRKKIQMTMYVFLKFYSQKTKKHSYTFFITNSMRYLYVTVLCSSCSCLSSKGSIGCLKYIGDVFQKTTTVTSTLSSPEENNQKTTNDTSTLSSPEENNQKTTTVTNTLSSPEENNQKTTTVPRTL